MSKANWIRSTMAFLIICQIINAWLGTIHKMAVIVLLVGALFAWLQGLVIEAALHTPPPQPKI